MQNFSPGKKQTAMEDRSKARVSSLHFLSLSPRHAITLLELTPKGLSQGAPKRGDGERRGKFTKKTIATAHSWYSLSREILSFCESSWDEQLDGKVRWLVGYVNYPPEALLPKKIIISSSIHGKNLAPRFIYLDRAAGKVTTFRTTRQGYRIVQKLFIGLFLRIETGLQTTRKNCINFRRLITEKKKQFWTINSLKKCQFPIQTCTNVRKLIDMKNKSPGKSAWHSLFKGSNRTIRLGWKVKRNDRQYEKRLKISVFTWVREINIAAVNNHGAFTNCRACSFVAVFFNSRSSPLNANVIVVWHELEFVLTKYWSRTWTCVHIFFVTRVEDICVGWRLFLRCRSAITVVAHVAYIFYNI